MCGIIGYVGKQPVLPILLTGLRRMEYRGYDSAGVAVLEDRQLTVVKKPGKLSELEKALQSLKNNSTVGIGHTRWATHGNPTEVNAHPHTAGKVTIVHNGIVENYASLRAELTKSGSVFQSDTDSEVIAHLIHQNLNRTSFIESVCAALDQVEGTFGLAILCTDYPDQIIAARRGSPLLIGLGHDETYIASDATAIVGQTDRVVYLQDDEVAVCSLSGCQIFDLQMQEQKRDAETISIQLGQIEKAGYEHFLMKEIMEQPKTVEDILRGRLVKSEGTSHLGGLNLTPEFLATQKRFLMVGCGTAYHAGLLGKYLLERMTGIPVDVECASEFRYREPALSSDTLAVLISQSGETADTLASLRELKRHSVPTVGLVNVVGSSVAREVDGGIYLHAGPEISVASTKAFTAQVIAELLLGLHIGRLGKLSLKEGQEIVEALEKLPSQIEQVLKQAPAIQKMAKKLARHKAAMYLGRDSMYPVALEASHKLKEISYIHAEAYPAGEMKHGANALIDKDLLVVFLVLQNALHAKTMSNLEEVKARDGQLLLVATEGDEEIKKYAEDIIWVPKASQWTEPILATVPLQIFAYYMAVEKGTDVDQPRNLAKSVTVE